MSADMHHGDVDRQLIAGLSALRQPGAADELCNREETVAAIADAMAEAAADPRREAVSAGAAARRRGRVAAVVIGAAAVAIGGVAAAGPGIFERSPVDEPVPTLPVTTVSAPTTLDVATAEATVDSVWTSAPTTTQAPPPTEVSPSTEVPVVGTTLPMRDEPGVAVGDEDAPAPASNSTGDREDPTAGIRECEGGDHGRSVSSIARDPDRAGAEVADVARTDCDPVRSHPGGSEASDSDDEVGGPGVGRGSESSSGVDRGRPDDLPSDTAVGRTDPADRNDVRPESGDAASDPEEVNGNNGGNGRGGSRGGRSDR